MWEKRGEARRGIGSQTLCLHVLQGSTSIAGDVYSVAKEENRARKGEFHLLHEHSGLQAGAAATWTVESNHLVGGKICSLLGISTDWDLSLAGNGWRKEKENCVVGFLLCARLWAGALACIISFEGHSTLWSYQGLH